MALRDIVLVGEDILREKAEPIEQFGPELRQLVKDMIETMQDADGVGLAGPQIAQRRRIVVIEVPEEVAEERDGEVPNSKWIGKPFALINPVIVETSPEQVEGMEGCLSIPGYLGEVVRHERVVVQARNEWGKPVHVDTGGFLARVIQHEIDHLDGILFIDRLESKDKLYKLEDLEEDADAESETEPAEAIG